MTAGYKYKERQSLDNAIRIVLSQNKKAALIEITATLISDHPQREDNIKKNGQYFLKHIEAIHICSVDKEANNGGCTEPHVMACRDDHANKATIAGL